MINSFFGYLSRRPGTAMYVTVLVGLVVLFAQLFAIVALDYRLWPVTVPRTEPNGFEILSCMFMTLLSIVNTFMVVVRFSDKAGLH